MEMGNVVVRPLPVGGLIAQQDFPIYGRGEAEKIIECSASGGTVHDVMLQGAPVPGYTDVYSTAVPGVGIRLSRVASSATTVYYPHTSRLGHVFGYLALDAKFRVELIKTAAVTGSGPLAQGIYTQHYADDGPAYSTLTSRILGAGTTIITPSCTVDSGSRNIPVKFGKVPLNAFRGVAASPAIGHDRNFNVTLNCSAGAGVPNRVHLRMDAQPDPSNLPGVLQITEGGSDVALGVGIQLLDQHAVPVEFGEDALVGQSRDGSFVIPFTARYFQTGDQVRPGRADGIATFTIVYK